MRIVEQIFRSAWNKLPPQTKKQIYTGLKNGDSKAIKDVVSIFKIPISEAKKYLGITAAATATSNKANASTNVDPKANSIKKLTPEKEAKLKAKGRLDLIQGSKSVAVQKFNYVTSKPYRNEWTITNITPEKLRSESIDKIITSLVYLLPGVPKSSITPIISQAKKLGGAKGVQYVTNAVRNILVKANPKAAQSIKEGTTKLTGSIDSYFKNIGKEGMASAKEINNLLGQEYSMATQKEIDSLFKSAKDGVITKAEEETLTSLVKENAKGLQALAKELNVTSKKDIPVLLKFVKDTYNLFSNAPKHIKAMATGATIAGGLGGLTLFDMYQSYRENGDTFAGLKTPIGKIIRNVLGYDGKDKLSKAAARKAGLIDGMTEKQSADSELGIFSQDLINSDVDEYFTGMSGRKYHNLNGYIYDFATGRPVNITDAINDYTQKLEYDDQQLVAKANNANQQLADLQQLRNSGYAVSDDQIMRAQNNVDLLQSQIASNKIKLETLTTPEFDSTGDLIEQYKSKIVQPQQQVQQAQAANQQREFNDVYKAAFERIAQDTYNDLDNYYGPQQQQVDYYTYLQKVDRNEAPYLSPDDFVKYQKMEYMKQMSPKIQQSALQYAQLASNQYINQQNVGLNQAKLQQAQYEFQAQNTLNQAKFVEEQRQNQIENRQKLMNYLNEVDRTNIQAQNAMSTKQRAEAATQANKLKQQEIEIQRNLQPYKQMEYMGSSLSGASMGGLTPDQFINANPEVAKQVFPSAFQEGNKPQQQQPKQNFVMSIFNQLRGGQ